MDSAGEKGSKGKGIYTLGTNFSNVTESKVSLQLSMVSYQAMIGD
jgi:hypothetical protein